MSLIPYDIILPQYFSRQAVVRAWGQVEAELAEIQAEIGMIPKDAGKAISTIANNFTCSLEKLREAEQQTGHPLVPFLRELEAACGEYGQYVHFGATSRNIMQTGLILRLQQAQVDIQKKQKEFLILLSDTALTHKQTILAGRTHTQHALPITFGYKIAGWLDEFSRHLIRQDDMHTRFFTAMMGGGVGSFASFHPHGKLIQDRLAERLHLTSMPIPLRSIADSYAEYISVLSLSASTIARMAADLRVLLRTEVGEIFLNDGSIGSSTMPQKRNPNLLSVISCAYQKMNSLLAESHKALDGDDDASSAHFPVIANNIQEAVQLYYYLLNMALQVIQALCVNTEKMKENLTSDGLWIMSESLMLCLSETLGKTEAHHLLHRLAMDSKKTGRSLLEACQHCPELADFDTTAIHTALTPEYYLGSCVELTETAVQSIHHYYSYNKTCTI